MTYCIWLPMSPVCPSFNHFRWAPLGTPTPSQPAIPLDLIPPSQPRILLLLREYWRITAAGAPWKRTFRSRLGVAFLVNALYVDIRPGQQKRPTHLSSASTRPVSGQDSIIPRFLWAPTRDQRCFRGQWSYHGQVVTTPCTTSSLASRIC